MTLSRPSCGLSQQNWNTMGGPIVRAFELIVIFIATWWFLAMTGTVDPPNWQEAGQRGRGVTNQIEQASQEFQQGMR